MGNVNSNNGLTINELFEMIKGKEALVLQYLINMDNCGCQDNRLIINKISSLSSLDKDKYLLKYQNDCNTFIKFEKYINDSYDELVSNSDSIYTGRSVNTTEIAQVKSGYFRITSDQILVNEIEMSENENEQGAFFKTVDYRDVFSDTRRRVDTFALNLSFLCDSLDIQDFCSRCVEYIEDFKCRDVCDYVVEGSVGEFLFAKMLIREAIKLLKEGAIDNLTMMSGLYDMYIILSSSSLIINEYYSIELNESAHSDDLNLSDFNFSHVGSKIDVIFMSGTALASCNIGDSVVVGEVFNNDSYGFTTYYYSDDICNRSLYLIYDESNQFVLKVKDSSRMTNFIKYFNIYVKERSKIIYDSRSFVKDLIRNYNIKSNELSYYFELNRFNVLEDSLFDKIKKAYHEYSNLKESDDSKIRRKAYKKYCSIVDKLIDEEYILPSGGFEIYNSVTKRKIKNILTTSSLSTFCSTLLKCSKNVVTSQPMNTKFLQINEDIYQKGLKRIKQLWDNAKEKMLYSDDEDNFSIELYDDGYGSESSGILTPDLEDVDNYFPKGAFDRDTTLHNKLSFVAFETNLLKDKQYVLSYSEFKKCEKRARNYFTLIPRYKEVEQRVINFMSTDQICDIYFMYMTHQFQKYICPEVIYVDSQDYEYMNNKGNCLGLLDEHVDFCTVRMSTYYDRKTDYLHFNGKNSLFLSVLDTRNSEIFKGAIMFSNFSFIKTTDMYLMSPDISLSDVPKHVEIFNKVTINYKTYINKTLHNILECLEFRYTSLNYFIKCSVLSNPRGVNAKFNYYFNINFDDHRIGNYYRSMNEEDFISFIFFELVKFSFRGYCLIDKVRIFIDKFLFGHISC